MAPASSQDLVRVFRPRWWWDGTTNPPVPNVEVVVRNKTFKLGSGALKPLSSTRINLPDSLLMPAWCNYHTHLELSHVRRPPYSGNFIEWLGTVMKSGPVSPVEASLAALAGAAESRSFGVFQLVDITRNAPTVRQAYLLGTDLRIHTCGEVTGLGQRWSGGSVLHKQALGNRNPLTAGLDDETLPKGVRSSRLTLGISPHAPYSTAADWYGRCAVDARDHHLTLTTHLAETPEERQFLATRTGPFAELWQSLGGLPNFEPEPEGPVAFLDRQDVFRGSNLIAAHCNDVTAADLNILAESNVTVVHCPRTHAYFERPPFDLERYERGGVKVRLGTDSKASAPDLDMRAEVATLAKRYPDRPLGTLVPLALPETFTGDLIAYPVSTDSPVEEILFSTVKPSHLFPAP